MKAAFVVMFTLSSFCMFIHFKRPKSEHKPTNKLISLKKGQESKVSKL